MKHRISLIAGAGGAGALMLALVGPGTFASFTSSVAANQSFKAGTFQLEAQAGTPTVSGPLIGDANSIGQPNLWSSTGGEPAVPNGNSVLFGLWNMNPGDTYTEPLTVYDVGSLQGQLDTITYTPDSGANAQILEGNMTVEVQVDVNNTWTDVHTTTGNGSPGVPVPASTSHTFYLDYSFGPQFLQPNPSLYTYSEAQANNFSTNELSASFRIVFSFTDTPGNQNAAEGLSASPTLSFNGINTP